jgi:hypothetical protein
MEGAITLPMRKLILSELGFSPGLVTNPLHLLILLNKCFCCLIQLRIYFQSHNCWSQMTRAIQIIADLVLGLVPRQTWPGHAPVGPVKKR